MRSLTGCMVLLRLAYGRPLDPRQTIGLPNALEAAVDAEKAGWVTMSDGVATITAAGRLVWTEHMKDLERRRRHVNPAAPGRDY